MKLFAMGAGAESGNENAAQRTLVIDQMRMHAPLIDLIEFYQMSGNADTPRKASGASGGRMRAIDNDFPDNKATPEFGSVALTVFGDLIQVDQAHVRRGIDLASARLRELKAYGRDLGKNFQNLIVNGDSANPNEFNGIKAQMPAARKTAFGYGVNTEALIRDLVQAIFLGIDDTPNACAIIMDAQLKSSISKYSDKIITAFTNELGKQVLSINGVQLVVAGKKPDGTRVLPWNPADSASETSVLIMYSGEEDGFAFASNSGLEVRDLGLVGSHWDTTCELDVDADLLDDSALYEITGIKGG